MEKPDLSQLRIERPALGAEDSAPSGNSKKAWALVAVVTSVLLLYLGGRLFGANEPSSQSTVPPKADTARAAPQGAQAPDSGGLTATGYVVAQRKAAVASKSTGRIKELNVREGDEVKKDQILAILENADVTSQVNERVAQVDALKARIQFAQAEVDDATLNRNRIAELRKRNAVSQGDFEQATARFKKAASELVSAQANLVVAEAQLEGARVDLSYTYILAPFDGTVLSKDADVGEVVAPFGSANNARAAVVTIADMASLEVEADVSESNLPRIAVGDHCDITLDSFPEKTYHGEVHKIVPTVDRAKATVLTKIKFLDKDDRVIPEMSAKVTFKKARDDESTR